MLVPIFSSLASHEISSQQIMQSTHDGVDETKGKEYTEELEDVLYRLQDAAFDALKALSAYCEENDLKLFLRGGSVLGAIKYGGFVPWDDDIDVALPRGDYERLIAGMPRLFDGYQFVAYQDGRGSHCYFPRIIMTADCCAELKLPCNNERGLVLIDVLPLDGMPPRGCRRTMYKMQAMVYRYLASLHTIETGNNKQAPIGPKQLIQLLAYSVHLHKLYTQDEIYRKMDNLYMTYPYEEADYVGMLMSSKTDREIMPADAWGNGTIQMFRDLHVLVPNDYKMYLDQLFGEGWENREPTEEQKCQAAHSLLDRWAR